VTNSIAVEALGSAESCAGAPNEEAAAHSNSAMTR
jgi:hypothetical protein